MNTHTHTQQQMHNKFKENKQREKGLVKNEQTNEFRFFLSIGLCLLLLALGMAMAIATAKLSGFDRPDALTLFHAGSLKGLATGVPMAQILIAPAQLGMVIIPLMIFHQLQLIIHTMVANRQGATVGAEPNALH